ncbi:MAG: outer membrane protein assembly factor BamD [Verrucomicrobiota bacterium]|nr:outer membrane protein assembly factor BamD [Verrucomicrobiota bacterium]
MRSRLPAIFLLVAVAFCLAETSHAVVIFGPKKGKVVAPGDEQISGSAQELFDMAQAAENSGNFGRAIKAYRSIVRRHPKDALASGAAFRYAQLQEKTGDYLKAAAAYRVLVENYPKSPHFDEAIEAQFRIGEMYLAGKKMKVLGIPIKASKEKPVEIFAAIVRTAPFGRYTARAQFDIGLATEKSGDVEGAVAAYQAVVEKFPNDPIAADAQYQIGYIWFKAAKAGVRDPKAAANAKLGFQDFLFRHPKSEKAAQARDNLRQLEEKQTTSAFEIAKYYDKQKAYAAAVIYYNDVIRQEPGSLAAERSKKRVAELRAKVGDAKLQSAELTAATAKKKKATPTTAAANVPPGSRGSGAPPSMMRTSPGDVAPLPPPEFDESLPPPASLAPDTTTAPDLPPSSAASPTPEAAASPEH